MRIMCPLVRKKRFRWAARVLDIQSSMISTFWRLSEEDMTVQNPSVFISGVSSGLLDHNLKGKNSQWVITDGGGPGPFAVVRLICMTSIVV